MFISFKSNNYWGFQGSIKQSTKRYISRQIAAAWIFGASVTKSRNKETFNQMYQSPFEPQMMYLYIYKWNFNLKVKSWKVFLNDNLPFKRVITVVWCFQVHVTSRISETWLHVLKIWFYELHLKATSAERLKSTIKHPPADKKTNILSFNKLIFTAGLLYCQMFVTLSTIMCFILCRKK